MIHAPVPETLDASSAASPAPIATVPSPHLTSLAAPSLGEPTSQRWTRQQSDEPIYATWLARLKRSHEATDENWKLAYILQAFAAYGAMRTGATGIGFGGSPLVAYLAAGGHDIMAFEAVSEAPPAHDLSAALADLNRQGLCPPDLFARRVHCAVGDPMKILPLFLGRFDFLWSLDMDRLLPERSVMLFWERSLSYLAPGGLAVHVLDRFSDQTPSAGSVGRGAVERLALHCIAQGHDVAQIRFRDGGSRARQPVPFGLIVRKRLADGA